MTCCRAGVSGLRVDTGRWEYVYVAAGKKIRLPRISRTCLLCGRGVEDVKHVLCACPVYANERKILLKACEDDETDTSGIIVEGQVTNADGFCKFVLYRAGMKYVQRFLVNALYKRAELLQDSI